MLFSADKVVKGYLGWKQHNKEAIPFGKTKNAHAWAVYQLVQHFKNGSHSCILPFKESSRKGYGRRTR